MKQRIYFAHPINTYDTEMETALICAIYMHFDRQIVVINPSGRIHQQQVTIIRATSADRDEASCRIMDYFLGVARECQKGVGLAFPDGALGAGVFRELECIQKSGQPIWLITPKGEITPMSNLNTLQCLSIEETRARVYNPDKTIRPFSAKTPR